MTASTPVAAGSSSNTSAAIRPNGYRVVACNRHGSSSTGCSGRLGRRSSSLKQRTHGPTPGYGSDPAAALLEAGGVGGVGTRARGAVGQITGG